MVKGNTEVIIGAMYAVYDCFFEYIDFYNIHNYFTHRNIILSLLLDDSIFYQNIILKQGKILTLKFSKKK